MRHAGGFSVCLLTLLCSLAARADEESPSASSPLLPPRCVHADGVTIDTKAVHAAPCLADWNGDGRLDLLVGEADGRLRVYWDRASAGPPRLEDGGLVEIDGTPVHVAPG